MLLASYTSREFEIVVAQMTAEMPNSSVEEAQTLVVPSLQVQQAESRRTLVEVEKEPVLFETADGLRAVSELVVVAKDREALRQAGSRVECLQLAVAMDNVFDAEADCEAQFVSDESVHAGPKAGRNQQH